MQNKKPLVVFTGLALAAVAGVLGITRDRWMGQPMAPATLIQAPGGNSTATEQGGATGQTTSDATQQQASAPATTAPAEPAAPAPAAAPEPGTAPAATAEPAQPAQQAATEPGTAPAATTEPAQSSQDGQQQAAVEPSGEPPVATTTEQPVQDSQTQGATQPAVEQPAAAPAAEAKPTFDTVRVEKTGEAVIAGRASPNAQVAVLLDGQPIGTATATSDGSFVVIPEKALPAGSGALTIEARGSNETVALKSDQQVAVLVPEGEKKEALVAVMTPGEPTKVLQKPAAPEQPAAAAPATAPAAQVTVDAIDYDAAGNILFSGTAAAGAALRLYVDNAVLADATTGADGHWSLASAAVAPGNHTLRVDALDAAAKVTARVELPFTREAAANVAQAEPGQAAAPAGEAAPKDGKVVIQPGNNLWRIARVIYGDGRRYTEIFEANKDLIKDPDRIYPGQVFATPQVVPPETIDPGRRDPLTPEEAGATAQ